jgi:hypothetical protein
MDLKDLRLGHFDGRVGETFAMELGDRVEEVKLVEAYSTSRSPQEASFSLVFRASRDVLLPQSTYDLEHADLGVLAIFLVPIASKEDGVYYEAVFTRLEDTPATG